MSDAQEPTKKEEPTDLPPTAEVKEPAAVATGPDLPPTKPADPFDKLDKLREKLVAKESAAAQPGDAATPEPAETTPPTNPDPEAPAGDQPTGAKPEPVDGSPKPPADPTAEIERLRREIRERDGRHGAELERLRKERDRVLAELETAKTPKQEAVARAKLDDLSNEDITDDDLERAFGSDWEERFGREYAQTTLLGMRRESRRIIESELGRMVDSRLSAASARTAEESAIADLERLVPGAARLDADADVNGFEDYLNEDYAETGMTRRQVATNALEVLKSGVTGDRRERMLKVLSGIYKGFGADSAPVQSQPTEPTGAESTAPGGSVDLKKYAMPKASRSDGTPGARKYSRAQLLEIQKKSEGTPQYAETVEWALKQAALGNVID